jgi:hypothetical protein
MCKAEPMEELMTAQHPGRAISQLRVLARTSSLQGAVKLSFSWAEKNSGAVTTL